MTRRLRGEDDPRGSDADPDLGEWLRAIARAASTDEQLPLNESGAITTVGAASLMCSGY